MGADAERDAAARPVVAEADDAVRPHGTAAGSDGVLPQQIALVGGQRVAAHLGLHGGDGEAGQIDADELVGGRDGMDGVGADGEGVGEDLRDQDDRLGRFAARVVRVGVEQQGAKTVAGGEGDDAVVGPFEAARGGREEGMRWGDALGVEADEPEFRRAPEQHARPALCCVQIGDVVGDVDRRFAAQAGRPGAALGKVNEWGSVDALDAADVVIEAFPDALRGIEVVVLGQLERADRSGFAAYIGEGHGLELGVAAGEWGGGADCEDEGASVHACGPRGRRTMERRRASRWKAR